MDKNKRVLAFKSKRKKEVLKKLFFLETSPKKYTGIIVLEDEPDGYIRIAVDKE